MRGPRDNGCEHVPVLMADPANPRYVQVECCRCHLQTGYATDPYEAWAAWRDGNVWAPCDVLEGEEWT